ncbi:serine/threonine-protein phosphatase 4 regulatory subunit 3A isoform X2 [Lingula anatina]|uniref:Serine/threonine-protein phosphatase 4 regulatory subunit 3A isoform X2 n=1 Tax=Lingula anatina TaxID=7574 RepID=A0A1S3JVF7_LINAN|nr:serine/threonine-protein phosphatase 4 regulatory subunit 3A isoform X2 [Lingula anatina]|eukprot:XP_013414069.1 serine/threonine-protein phosphatase 4 regulatory subunit 3A isoform X2 [Lingula anatina]
MAADTGTSTRRRVKLYMLNENRTWDDRGTGHVSYAYVERLKGMSLLVLSETDGSLLLESKILPDTAYQKQQETLIVWSEGENYDLALSFQEKAGCDEIWEKICQQTQLQHSQNILSWRRSLQVQGKDPSVDITQDIVEGESEEEHFDEIPDAAPPIELPPCVISTLEEISELFTSVLPSPIRREKLAVAIENENYIKKLIDLFHMCEDLENLEGLHHLYDIFKSIFLLNKNALFEIMFNDDVIMDIVGVLEYDPALPQPAKHREYLSKTAKFKEVIPITSQELLQKIHQTYKVQYIQDVILPTPSVFEENMLSTLGSFIFFNKVEIVGMIQNDERFLETLFKQLRDEETDDEKRGDLVLFLKEFCTFSQTLQQQNRDSFFKALSNLGILSALEVILGLEDPVMKSAAIDIFSFIVEYSPSMVREFILHEGRIQDDDDLLINLVIEQMVSDPDPELGGAVQLIGIIRLLIDPENMLATANKTEKTEFLSFFYKHCMHVMTAPLFANTVGDKPNRDDYRTAQLLGLTLELLAFCVEHHTYHIKNYIINKDLLRRVLVLMNSKHAFLALCALRFMRRVLSLKDEFYNRYIIKGCLFQPVVDAFKANGDRYNLLNSAIIEMFEFIRVEDVKSVCSHIVEVHYKAFEHVDYVQTFRALKLRYDQQQERLKDKTASLENTPTILRNNRYRRDARTLEEDEEMWFDQDDDFEDGDTMKPVSEMLSKKLESDFDQINKYLESRRVMGVSKENEFRDSPPRMNNRTSPININLKTSPSNSPVHSPLTSPVGSPASPNGTPTPPKEEVKPNNVVTNKPLVGLVDYPDEDSDEEEEEADQSSMPAAKRPRLAS